MFVLTSTYTRPPRDKALVARHIAFVDARHEDGTFVASGARPGSVGGVVVARGTDEAELRAVMAEDPFILEGLVEDYEYVQFHASRSAHDDLLDTLPTPGTTTGT